jgi:CheY-like chemotaxis protein
VKTDEFGNRRIKTIEDSARRAGQMVSKLLSFARKESLELVPADLNAVVMDTVELLGRALIDRNISAEVTLDPDLPAVIGDSIHLEQVIANLVMNAMDAMPGGGAITLSTARRDLGVDSRHAYPFLPPGGYAVLTVRDTGTGIPREIMDRIFDPFFTTKPAGKGTGLGLAMVYGIVKSHRGEVRVTSEEGEGTAFDIYLPASDQPAAPSVPPELTGDGELPPTSKGERILVVDDEEDVLSFIKDALEARGYVVFTADTPISAQELFQELSGGVDVVITDIVMPVMNGAELTKFFKQAKPALKVIGVSGYDGGAIVDEARNIDCFIKKPFDGDFLHASIRRLLDPNTAGGSTIT